MSWILRIELILFAAVFLVVVFWAVSRKKLQLRYSLVWLLIALCIILAACFPGLVMFLSDLVGIETPSNFIYFLGIIVLLVLCFSLTCIVSRQSEQIKRLAQQLGIQTHDLKKKEEDPVDRRPG